MKPSLRPQNPCFSSGPCAKRPGWSPRALDAALVGRSHRSKDCRARIQEVIDRSRALLGVPDGYHQGRPLSCGGETQLFVESTLVVVSAVVVVLAVASDFVSAVTSSLIAA